MTDCERRVGGRGRLLSRHAEERHRINQLPRLSLETVGRSRAFFHQGGVLLGHLVHLRDGIVHLRPPWLCSALAALISPTMCVTR